MPKVECSDCKKDGGDNWDLWCIRKSGRCINCQKKWEAKPENDPENKRFEVEYSITDHGDAVIYAKDEKSAREEFENNYEYDEYEITEK